MRYVQPLSWRETLEKQQVRYVLLHVKPAPGERVSRTCVTWDNSCALLSLVIFLRKHSPNSSHEYLGFSGLRVLAPPPPPPPPIVNGFVE